MSDIFDNAVNEVFGKPKVEPSIDQVVQDSVGVSQESYDQSMFVAKEKDPTTMAEATKYSQKYKVPAFFAEQNLEVFKKKELDDELSYANVSAKSERIANLMQDPEYAVLAKDDVDQLMKLDPELSRLKNYKDSSNYFMDLGGAMKSGYSSLKSGEMGLLAAYNLADVESDDFWNEFAARKKAQKENQAKRPSYMAEFDKKIGEEVGDVKKAWSKFTSTKKSFQDGEILNGFKNLGQGAVTIGEFLDLVGETVVRPTEALYTAAESAAYSLPSIALGMSGGLIGSAAGPVGSVVGGVTGAGLGTVWSEVGGWIDSKLEEKGYDLTSAESLKKAYQDKEVMKEIRAEAMRKGLTMAAVEMVSLGIGSKFLKAGKGLKGKVIQGTKAVAAESAIEGVGEGVGQLAAYKGDTSKIDLQDIYMESIGAFGQNIAQIPLRAGIAAAMNEADAKADAAAPSDGTTTPPSSNNTDTPASPPSSETLMTSNELVTKAKEFTEDYNKVMQTTENGDALQKIGEVAQESKLAERSPEAFAETIDNSFIDSERKQVFFQANDWDEAFTALGEDPVQKAEELLVLDKYLESKETGVSFDVSVKDMVSKLARSNPEAYTRLLQEHRPTPDGYKMAEAQERTEEILKEVQGVAKQAERIEQVEQQKVQEKREFVNYVRERTKSIVALDSAGESAFISMFETMASGDPQNRSARVLFDEFIGTIEQGGTVEQDALNQEERVIAPAFYSKLEKTIKDKMGKSATVAQVKALIREQKTAEVKYSKIESLLEGKANTDKLTKDEVLAVIQDSQVQLKEIVLTSNDRTEEMLTGQESPEEKQDNSLQEKIDLRNQAVDALLKALNEKQGQPKTVYGYKTSYDSDTEYFTSKEDAEESRQGNIDRFVNEYEEDGLSVQEVEIEGETKYFLSEEYNGDEYREYNPENHTAYDSEQEAYDVLNERTEEAGTNLAEDYFGEIETEIYDPDVHEDIDFDEVDLEEFESENLYGYVLQSPSGEFIFNEDKRMLSFSSNTAFQKAVELTGDDLVATIKNSEEYKKREEELKKEFTVFNSYQELKDSGFLKTLKKQLGVTDKIIKERIKEGAVYFKQTQDGADSFDYSYNNPIDYELQSFINYEMDAFDKKAFNDGEYKGYKFINLDISIVTREKETNTKAKWSDIALGGPKENYKETLVPWVNAPENVNFIDDGQHYVDKNIVVHVRSNERETDKGKTLFVEEIQSDWYKESTPGNDAYKPGTPEIPFKNYEELGFRTALRLAIKQGLDRISWTTGEIQNTRNSLAQSFNRLQVYKRTDGYEIKGFKDGRLLVTQEYADDKLNETVGQDLADKIRNDFANYDGAQNKSEDTSLFYEGDDLSIGRQGLKQLYDKKLVSYANKYMKKFGVQVETAKVSTARKNKDVTNSDRLVNRQVELHKQMTDRFKSFEDIDFEEDTDYPGEKRYLLNFVNSENGEGYLRIKYDPRELNNKFLIVYDSEVTGTVRRYADNIEDLNRYLGFTAEEFKSFYLGALDAKKDSEFDTEVHSIAIPEELKKQIEAEGQVLFQEDQGEIFGQTIIDPELNKMSIKMFTTKNMTTFSHESAHVFLELYKRVYKEGSTDRNSVIFKDIMDWLGVDSADQITREMHERFADAYTVYLAEGKAPSNKLKKAFQRFTLWLTKVYREALAADVKMNDEIRDIFDRMLATDEEILEAKQSYPKVQMFQNPETAGMPKSVADKYVVAIEESGLDAGDKTLQRLLKDRDRKKKKIYQIKLRKIKDQLREQYKHDALLNAMNVFAKGTLTGNRKKPDSMKGLKLNRAEFQLRFRDLIEDKKFQMMLSDNGQQLDVAVGAFGFNNIEDFVAKAQQVPLYNEFINVQAELEMQKTDPDLLLNDEELQETATKELHDSDREFYIRAEYEHLATNNPGLTREIIRRVVSRPIPNSVLKSQSIQVISKMKVEDIKPNVYRLAERKYAKEAGKLLAKGDLEGAFKAKQNELINFYLYKEAVDVKRRTQNKLAKLEKRYNKKDDDIARTRNIDMVLAGRAILARFGKSKFTNRSPLDLIQPIKVYNSDAYANIAALVTQVMSEDMMGVRSFEALTVEQATRLTEMLDQLWMLAREDKTLDIEGQKIEIKKAVDEMIAVGPEGKADPTDRAFTEDEKVRIDLAGYTATLKRFEYVVDVLDGGNFLGPFRKYLYQPIERAYNLYIDTNKIYMKKLKKILDKWKDINIYKPIKATEINYTFDNKSQLLHVMLHLGNESNREKLLLGYGWGKRNDSTGLVQSDQFDKFIARMFSEGVLSKTDMDAIQEIWDLNEEIKPMAQKAYRKIFGSYFGEISAETLNTPVGVYRGGYVPAYLDMYKVNDIKDKDLMKQIIENSPSNILPTSGGKGFTIKRQDQFAAPLELDITRLAGHIESVIRFSIMKPAVADVLKVLQNKQFSGYLSTYDKNLKSKVIIPFLNRADKNNMFAVDETTSNAVNKINNELRKRTSMQIMFGNAQNILEQLFQAPAALSMVKKRFLVNGYLAAMKQPLENKKNIAELSLFMKDRWDRESYKVQRALGNMFELPNKWNLYSEDVRKAQMIAEDITYFGQSATQFVIDIGVWNGAYNQALSEGMSGTQAVEFADSVIRKTQASGRSIDVSTVQTNRNLAIVQMFIGFFNNSLNFFWSQNKIAKAKSTGNLDYLMKASMIYFYVIFMPSVGSAVVQKLLSGKDWDDDDDDEVLDDVAFMVMMSNAKFIAAMVPLYGQVAIAGLNRQFTTQKYDDRASLSPALNSISDTGYFLAKLATQDLFQDPERFSKDMKETLGTLGMITGLPLTPLYKPLTYVEKVNSGEAQPSGPIDAVRGLVTGQAGE